MYLLKLDEMNITYHIERKKVKNTSIRIKGDGTILVVANTRISQMQIENFLFEKKQWVASVLEKNKKKEVLSFSEDNCCRDTINLLAKEYKIKHVKEQTPSLKNIRRIGIYLKEDLIQINTVGIYLEEKKNEVFKAWIDNYSREMIIKFLDEIYPLFKKYKIPYPKVRLRKMKTRWGTCSMNLSIITLNALLIHVETDIIKYVITHELAHFVEGNHSKSFYKVVEDIMPNYRIYEQKLKNIRIID